MDAANTEVQTGEPSRRVLLIEEAHSFLPEWNFSTRPEQDHVHESARYILQPRKFGLSFVFISQRTRGYLEIGPESVREHSDVPNHRPTSLDFIERVVGPEFRAVISGLQRYQALCVGPIFNTEAPVIADLLAPEAAHA